ncbi:hypothetical protein [uncultured Aeromicrobium sp.]|uniref:hypothetical protein n=1 Tax=uncultured Aeromicrobium sp. TaxID=337820 RepID=UPI0025EFCA1B|nr:hypothetical protein [uncultured Aeromicrobium sp.]
MSRPLHRRASSLITAVAALALLAGCGVVDRSTGATPTPAPSASNIAESFASEFTRDGTFQSHDTVDGIDFVFTIWPTKSTPRTNEWYPRGEKNFSFTFQTYDMDRDFRDSFSSKRQAFLQHIKVTSTITSSDGAIEDGPYRLDATAQAITFDPEPLANQWGMLVTSPKGAFELRNQTIGDLPENTVGITLRFEATVWVEQKPGAPDVEPRVVTQEVPIAIFASDTPTEQQEIPLNAN